ncbi:MAG: hypothetical protein AB8F26_05270 [Phycisphaerales bacterium]
MHELRQYPSLPSAWSAAAFLRSEGVLARGYQREAGRIRLGMMGGPTQYEAWVAVAFEPDLPAANEILDEFDQSPLPSESDWHDQTEPDLSKLPSDLVVPCEWCKADFRTDINSGSKSGTVIRCRSCNKDNDPVDRVVAKHGPEALLGCYPEATDPDWIDAATLDGLRLPCQRCGYRLSGLSLIGQCPECAEPYDKRAIIEKSFLDIQV